MVVKALAEKLPEHGFKTEVICLREPGEIGRKLAESDIPVISGVCTRRFDPAGLLRLKGILERGGFSVLLCLDHHDAIFLGALASRLAGTLSRVLCVHSTGLWTGGGSFNFTDRIVLGSYDIVIALAKAHAEYMSKEGVPEKRIRVINNGIDTGRFVPVSSDERKESRRALGVNEEDFIVSIVAALRPEKNHAMFIEAAGKVAAGTDNVTFLIAGDGSEAGKLQEMGKDLAGSGKLKFLGLCKEPEKVYSASDLCVLCSHPVVETFPLTILEAMSCGLPVIATSVGSIPEMIERDVDGLLVESGDAEALASAIVSLMSDPRKRQMLGTKARDKVVDFYSEDMMIGRYAGVLRELTDRGKDAG